MGRCGLKDPIDFNQALEVGKPRFVPMNTDLVNLLKACPAFPNTSLAQRMGRPQWTNYRKSFEGAVRKANLTDFRFHDLRHTFASALVMCGVGLKQ